MISKELTEQWQFLRKQLAGPWEVWRHEHGVVDVEMPWEEVTLPHCFTGRDCVTPGVPYYQGEAWYRRMLEVENPYPDGRTLLRFAGAGQRTDVFALTRPIGSHLGGYDAFDVDLTDIVQQFNGRIPLSIRCSNARDVNLIPSDLSDFTLHGGIYRSLEVVYVPAISLSEFEIRTSVEEVGGSVSFGLKLRHSPALKDEVSWMISIQSPHGKTLKCIAGEDPIWTETHSIPCIHLPLVERWSVDSPSLYQARVTLRSKHGETTQEKKFGFREFCFKEGGPFYLNGSRLLLRGTHRHEDHAEVGAAMNRAQITREMRMIKHMGANFIRLGHYQQSDIVLDLCDELGLLVWEEIPWCRGGLGGVAYQENAKAMLRQMILQHRHHPSIILWGLGNENDWPGDFESFEEDRIATFVTELHALAKSLDPDRSTSLRRCDFCSHIPDVYSPSIWVGWYRGNYRQYRDELEEARRRYPRWMHIEWGADSHAGRHVEEDCAAIQDITSVDGGDERMGDFLREGGDMRVSRDGDWSETYCCDLIDWHLKEQESCPWLSGSAYWPFKDFSTPLRPENPIPYVNQKGVVQRNLEPKESYYVFQSYWATAPMLRIYGHSWTDRWGHRDEKRKIRVYSNCPSVEVFLNGRSLGVKARRPGDFPCSGLHWEQAFRSGANLIEAVADLKDGIVLRDEIRFTFHSEIGTIPARMKPSLVGIGQTITLEVLLVDSKGRLCPLARNLLQCEVWGKCNLVTDLGHMGGASVCEAATGRAFWNINVTGRPAYAMVRCENLPEVYLELTEGQVWNQAVNQKGSVQ